MEWTYTWHVATYTTHSSNHQETDIELFISPLSFLLTDSIWIMRQRNCHPEILTASTIHLSRVTVAVFIRGWPTPCHNRHQSF